MVLCGGASRERVKGGTRQGTGREERPAVGDSGRDRGVGDVAVDRRSV